MRIFQALVIILCMLSVFAFRPSLALRPPPMEVVALSGEIECLAIAKDWMSGQPNAYGTFQKGPAVKFTNICDAALDITGLERSEGIDKKGKKLSATDYVGLSNVYGVPGDLAWPFYFSSSGSYCKENLFSALIGGLFQKTFYCRRVRLGKGVSIKVPMPWQTKFKLAGRLKSGEGFLLAGQVVNPMDVEYRISANLAKAEAGDPQGYIGLADAYYQRRNDGDKEKAVFWYRKAYEVEGSKGRAAAGLGSLYKEENPEESFVWYQKAAAENIYQAPCVLSQMYAEGRGTSEDKVAALLWRLKPVDASSLVRRAQAGETAAKTELIELLKKSTCIYFVYNDAQVDLRNKEIDWYLE